MDKLRLLWPIIREERRAFLWILAATIAGSLMAALQPWPVKWIVDHVLGSAAWPAWLGRLWDESGAGGAPAWILAALVAAGLALVVAAELLNAVLTWLWTVAGRRLVNRLAEDLFARLQRRSLIFHSRTPVGELMSRITGDSWCVHQVADTFFFAPLHAGLSIAAMVVLMWPLNAVLTGVTLLLAPLVVAASIWMGRPLRQAALARREAEGAIHAHLQQTLTGLPTVQGFTREEHEQARFEQFAHSAIRAQQRSALFSNLNQLTSGFMATAGTGLVLWLGAQQVLEGRLSVGGLLLFLAYLAGLQGQVKVVAGLYPAFQATRAGLDRVAQLLTIPPEVSDRPTARRLDRARGAVAFEGVSFGYETGRPVLRDITVRMQPGQTVAIVGPTGSGKSTLAALVARFFDPWQGRVVVEGCDARDWTLESLRAHVSLLAQEPFLWPVSVAENIALGRPEASRQEIVAAARAAQAHEFIERLPQGYETVVGERGVTLSGGERQRLAMARAFLKNAPILILDEPTSALDVGTERQVVAGMERLMAGRTTLLIAHRLSTVARADLVLFLEEGRLVEAGSPAELLARGGRFARFHALQGEGSRRGEAS